LSDAPRSVADVLAQQRSIRDVMLAMRRCPQPIVALVQGAASGGGFALALAADLRLATPDARMNVAFIRIGLSGCDVGVSYFLPRMVGSSVAAELMLTGRFLTAQRALALGLVSAVAPMAELKREADALVADMLRASPLGLRLTKDALGLSLDAGGMEAVIAMEDRNQVLCAVTDDFREAKAAFIEKRAPIYRDH
jgi:enoyl-CoA hydratase/carnithine racemase